MNAKVRVTQLFNRYLEKGGEEVVVHQLLPHLQDHVDLNTVEFLSSDWTGPQAPPAWRQAILMWRNPASLKRIQQMEARKPSDVWLFHNVFPVGSAVLYREALRRKIPMVMYLHNYRPFSVNGYLWTDRVEPAGLQRNFFPEIRAGAWQASRLKTLWYAGILEALHTTGVFRQVARWIAISDFVRERFIEAGIAADRIDTIRHPWMGPQAAELPLDDQGYYLFLGRLGEMKGVDVLLSAWKLLGPSAPSLRIAGEGPLCSHVQEAASTLPSVEYVGWVNAERKQALLSGARALIVPSRWWEALGLVVYEAYAHRTPVLASGLGGLSEIVHHESTGFLFSPDDAESLAGAVERSEANPAEMARMGCVGREWLDKEAGITAWKSRMQEALQTAATFQL